MSNLTSFGSVSTFNALTAIGTRAFQNSGLTSFGGSASTFEALTTIGNNAFQNSTSLSSFGNYNNQQDIINAEISIGSDAFKGTKMSE